MGRDRPRVLGCVDESSGCALYRTWTPLAALKHQGWEAEWLLMEDLKPYHLAGFDLVVLCRLGGPQDHVLRLAEDARRAGCVLVYECDDDLWRLEEANPDRFRNRTNAPGLRELLSVCQAATTTNAHLAARIREEAGWDLPVHVLPNAVDARIWEGAGRARADRRLTVGVHGGNSHARDWAPLVGALTAVGERHPEVRLLCAGDAPPDFVRIPGLLLAPFVPLPRYPALVAELDVACCPLEATPFNACKSPIKWFESTLGGAACVVSETVYGPAVRQAGAGTALVVPPARDRDPDAWAEALLRLVEDPTLRRRVQRRARAAVLDRWEISRRWRDWAKAYREIWARSGPGGAG